MRTFRISLVVIAISALGCVALLDAWSSLQTGVATLPIGRGARFAIQFAHATDPVAFYGTIALFCAFGVAFVAGGVWWLCRLMSSSSRQKAMSEVAQVITGLEKDAPSGLRPLWIGLLLFGSVMLVLYAFA